MYYTNGLCFLLAAATSLSLTLTFHEVRAYPTLDATISDVSAIDDVPEGRGTAQVNDTTTISHPTAEVLTEEVFQKCKRNKRHVHRPHGSNPSSRMDTPDNAEETVSTAKSLPTTSTLSATEIQDIETQFHMERFKRKFLDKLRLERPPVVTSARPNLPPRFASKMQPSARHPVNNEGRNRDATDSEINGAEGKSATTSKQIIVVADNGKFVYPYLVASSRHRGHPKPLARTFGGFTPYVHTSFTDH